MYLKESQCRAGGHGSYLWAWFACAAREAGRGEQRGSKVYRLQDVEHRNLSFSLQMFDLTHQSGEVVRVSGGHAIGRPGDQV